MGLSCGMSLIKFVLFVFNLLCALCGIALLAIGIIYLIDLKEFDKIVEELSAEGITAVTIALGAIIFLIAFLGCCGAIRESYCMILTYSVVIGLLLIAKIVIAVIVLVKRDEVQLEVEKVFDKLWNQRETDTTTKDFIFKIQESLECCGYNDFNDYSPLNIYPDSCCPSDTVVGNCTTSDVFKNGCKNQLQDWIKTGAAVIAGVVLGVAAVELIALIFSCCLANSIRNSRSRHV
jgi:CD63 antigen